MNDVILESIMGAVEIQANRTIIQQQEQLPPIWILVNEANEIKIEILPWRNDLEKELVKIIIKTKIRAYNAVAYSFASECWVAKAPPKWTPGMPLKFGRPSKDPARMECVLAFASLAFASHSKTKLWRYWEIKRNQAKEAIELCRLDRMERDMEDVTGWMVELL